MRKWFLIVIVLSVAVLLGQRIEVKDPGGNSDTQTVQNNPKIRNSPILERLRKDIRDVTPPGVLAVPQLEGDRVERLPAKLIPPPPRPPKPLTWPRPAAISAGMLESNGMTIILAGITALPLEKTCTDKVGNSWPCGEFAKTALRQFIRNRSIECAPAQTQSKKTIKTRCQLAGYDISAWIVWQGWATPKTGLFEEQFAEAKTKGYGQWRERAPGR